MLSTLQLPDGTYSESDEETLTLLTMVHFPGFEGPTDVGGSSQKCRPLPATQLTIHEKLPQDIAGDPIIGPLVRLSGASLTLGYVPKAWRGIRVIFIPKVGENG